MNTRSPTKRTTRSTKKNTVAERYCSSDFGFESGDDDLETTMKKMKRLEIDENTVPCIGGVKKRAAQAQTQTQTLPHMQTPTQKAKRSGKPRKLTTRKWDLAPDDDS